MTDIRWETYLKDVRFRQKSTGSKIDGRDPFENDYSRLISSAPIRRLQDKTQVFPLEKSDFVRTRLTHSLEVSAIARSIGKSVEFELVKRGLLSDELKGQISSLLATTGLIHDLGNPPFGHYGEKAIQSFFSKFLYQNHLGMSNQERADLINFDGNVQTLRILRRLYYLFDNNGYNLTFPTLHVIVKYPTSSMLGNLDKKATNVKDKKFGYFASEEADFKTITETLELHHNRHPVTYLLEAADDIAYSAADIEDGVKLGILDFHSIIELFEPFIDKNDKAQTDLLDLIKKNYEGLNGTTLDRLDITIQLFRISVQTLLIESIIEEFFNNYESIMKGEYKSELLNQCKRKNVKKGLDALITPILKHKKVINIELAGWNVIHGLLEEYIPICLEEDFKPGSKTKAGRFYQTISSSYRYLFENHNTYPNEKYKRLQLVTDFISGMTDTYALELYQKMKGIRTI